MCSAPSSAGSKKDTEYYTHSDGSRQQETNDGRLLPLIHQINFQCDVGLHPAEQSSQSKRQTGAQIVNHLLSEYLKPQ